MREEFEEKSLEAEKAYEEQIEAFKQQVSIQEGEIMAQSNSQEDNLRKIQEAEKKNEANQKKVSDLESMVEQLKKQLEESK